MNGRIGPGIEDDTPQFLPYNSGAGYYLGHEALI